jgi:transposase
MLSSVDTFVIRLWPRPHHPAPPGAAPRGAPRHVGTGRAAAFRDGDELIALLRDLPGRDEESSLDEIEADGARHHD